MTELEVFITSYCELGGMFLLGVLVMKRRWIFSCLGVVVYFAALLAMALGLSVSSYGLSNVRGAVLLLLCLQLIRDDVLEKRRTKAVKHHGTENG
jgi:hypothetical protein